MVTLAEAPAYFARYRKIIPDFEGFLAHLRRDLPLYFRLNDLKCPDPELVLKGLARQGAQAKPVPHMPLFYQVEPRDFPLGNTEEYYLGYIYPMTLNSALPVYALAPEPGEIILDMCAAPGSKTTQIAQATKDRAVIVANDRRLDRLTALVANLKRLGVACAITTVYRGEEFPFGIPFDKVLVDAPCSGEGRYRQGYEGELLYQKEGHTNLPAIQKGLLIRAFDLVKVGGVVVYSTCTINPDENELVVDYLLRKRQGRIIPCNYPQKYHSGVTEWEGKILHPDLKQTARFFPHETESVGFFIAKIQRLA